MRYINLFILCFIMTVTWSFVQSDQSVPEIVHAEIQDDLKELISNYIKKQLPSAKNLQFDNIWSESISDGKVKAHFKYSFDDNDKVAGNAGILIDGFAILLKQDEQQDQLDVWTLEEIQILNNHVTFDEGITLSKDYLESELPEGHIKPTEDH